MLTRLSDGLWNPWLLGLFLAAGLYFSLATGFFQIFRVRVWLGATLGSLRRGRSGGGRGISQWQAVATALASTIGTGSVAGVATAIWFGGPGAVFWMWVCALLGMMTGCVEKTLAVLYRTPGAEGAWRGGPMYYLRRGVGSRALGGFYALVLLPATLAGGNLVQSSSIAASLEGAFGAPRLATGLVIAGLAGAVMAGGLGRVARVSSLLVPVMGAFYLGGGLWVLAARAQEIPAALALIVTSALSPSAAAGGGAGYALGSALRYGVARGVFTNEAGLGTSAIAHAQAETDDPAHQGMWGILEVFCSTLLVCTVTALVILCSGVYQPQEALALLAAGATPPEKLGAPLTAAAFASVLGRGGELVVACSLALFAFSSILGWSYYGQAAITYLGGGRRVFRAYRLAFLLCVAAGSVGEAARVWQLVDFCNALLAAPNLLALLILSPRALECLRRWEEARGRR